MACEMEFKPNILILFALLLSFCPTADGDSGRNRARNNFSVPSKTSSSPYRSARQLENKQVREFRNQGNIEAPFKEKLAQKDNHILQSDSQLRETSDRLTWFQYLSIICLCLTTGMGLSVYVLWNRARLQKVKEELRIKSEHTDILQARLTHMQRTESLGMLASGVAHDFNNLLVGVLCNAELLEHEVSKPNSNEEFERERIDQIIQSAEKAADLSRQMLAYAGKTQIVKVPTELNSIISRLQAVLVSTAGRHVNLELDLSPDQIVANIDPTQIEQILLNLVSNASQASGDDGEIIIRTGTERIESLQTDEMLFGTRETGGHFVFFEVQDSGSGISDENIKHIFDPFFTSREDGRGLGLAVVFGFVKSHDGLIRAKTTCGEGTCFRILLPASASTPSFNFDAKPDDQQFATPLVEQMTILVVDDEPAVRDTAKALLESIGWKVYLARSGAHALQIMEHSNFHIDCVLLDVVMPNLGAKEVLEHFRSTKKNVCVVLMSGNSSEQLDPYRKSKEVSAVLAKPFKTQELVEAISTAVESHNNRPSQTY